MNSLYLSVLSSNLAEVLIGVSSGTKDTSEWNTDIKESSCLCTAQV